MPGKLTGYPLANSKGIHWPNVGRNLDAAAVHILTHRDIPGPWSKKRKVPPGTLHAKDIEEELDVDDVEGCQVYLSMKEDSRFYKPPVRRPALDSPSSARNGPRSAQGESAGLVG